MSYTLDSRPTVFGDMVILHGAIAAPGATRLDFSDHVSQIFAFHLNHEYSTTTNGSYEGTSAAAATTRVYNHVDDDNGPAIKLFQNDFGSVGPVSATDAREAIIFLNSTNQTRNNFAAGRFILIGRR